MKRAIGHHVLYVDYEGHASPLSCCFHATASRRLSSWTPGGDTRRPTTTLSEVDSAFCPQCLAVHDVSTAATDLHGNCPKASCKRCPLCFAVASVACVPASCDDDEDKMDNDGDNDGDEAEGSRGDESSSHRAFYRCGYCPWNSRGSLSVPVRKADGGGIGKAEMIKAVEALGSVLERRLAEGERDVREHFRSQKQALNDAVKAEVKRKKNIRKGVHTAAAAATTTTTITTMTMGFKPSSSSSSLARMGRRNAPWTIATLEASIRSRKDEEMEKITAASSKTMGGQPLRHITTLQTWHQSLCGNGSGGGGDEDEDDGGKGRGRVSRRALGEQSIVSAAPVGTYRDMLPLPMPLRPRKSRRCRAELSEGRPGILVKPKLNPLEGDTSLRTGHGQFWKKDSSAIHVIPRIVVVHSVPPSSSVSPSSDITFLLRVTNPTLGKVKLRLGPSSYRGVPVWGSPPKEANAGDGQRSSDLRRILVDPLSGDRLDAQLYTTSDWIRPRPDAPEKSSSLSSSTSSASSSLSEWVELEAMEDVFMEIAGGDRKKVPPEVQAWLSEMSDEPSGGSGGSGRADEHRPEGGTMSIRWVATKSDKAWFLLTVPEPSPSPVGGGGATTTTTMTTSAARRQRHPAIPISLQIQVGDGSWESSLIKPREEVEGVDAIDVVSFDVVLVWTPKKVKTYADAVKGGTGSAGEEEGKEGTSPPPPPAAAAATGTQDETGTEVEAPPTTAESAATETPPTTEAANE